MSANPRILLTNDDGIDAPGLNHLRKIAAALSDDVWVVAPATNQSGAGHRFTLGQELKLTKVGPREFSVNGSPADCVVAGCTHVLGDNPPDVVLSGINQGQNLGDIINCSGTIAAAREGALQGALGIALSQGIDYEAQAEVCWDPSIAYAQAVVSELMAKAKGSAAYFNVNFPYQTTTAQPDIRLLPHQRFKRSAFGYYPSQNEGHFFVTIPGTPEPVEEGFDVHALHLDGVITVTPLSLMQTDQAEIDRLSGQIGDSH